VLADLQAIYTDWRGAVQDFLTRPVVTSRELFTQSHFLLFAHIPLFSIVSPLPWIMGSHFSVTSSVLLPIAIPLFFVALAGIYDRILLHEKGPTLEKPGKEKPENAMLFAALPVCGTGLFFLIHPLVGIAMTVLSGTYCVVLFVRVAMHLYGLTLEKAILRVVGAFFFLMIPCMVLLLAANAWHTLGVLSRLLS